MFCVHFPKHPVSFVSDNSCERNLLFSFRQEFPFADTDPTTDLGQFYREMQSAPQLSMCEEHTVGFDEYLADIKGQIDRYTACQPNFEKFVKSICKEGEELSD